MSSDPVKLELRVIEVEALIFALEELGGPALVGLTALECSLLVKIKDALEKHAHKTKNEPVVP